MAASVMILESARIYRDLFEEWLDGHGYEAVPAADATQGLSLMRERKVALIVMEIGPTGAGGLEFLERVRQEYAAMPVIILTDRRDKETIIRAAKLGVRDYIFKTSLSAERLLERIGQLLSGAPALAPPAAEGPAIAAAKEAEPAQEKADPRITAGTTPLAKQPPKALAAKVAAAKIALVKGPIAGTAAKKAPDISQWPRPLTREKTLLRLDTVAGGKTIAGVVAQVVAVASSPNADLSDVVKIIQSDPMLASRVLHMANSAATGSRARVHNIDEATRAIGIRGIQNMAISIGIFGAFPPDGQDGFSTMRSWQHSFAVAELMGRIVRQKNPELEGFHHLVGLCHDMGEILLRQHFAEEHLEILRFASEHHLPIHLVESTGLGIRRPELISRLLTKVGLPANVVDAIREFHERQIKEQAGGISAGTQLLQMANHVAHGLLLTPTLHEEIKPISRQEWRVLGTDKTPPQIEPMELRNEIILATNVLARLPGSEEAKLVQPLIARTGLRIGYVRPETFITMDPLAYALQMLAETTVIAGMPTVEQMQGFDALVVAGIRVGISPVVPEELAGVAAAAGLPEMPMLALVGQMGAAVAAAAGGATVRMFPIRLEDLHVWLLEAEAAKKLHDTHAAV